MRKRARSGRAARPRRHGRRRPERHRERRPGAAEGLRRLRDADRGAVGRGHPRGSDAGGERWPDRLHVHRRHRLLGEHGARPAPGRREEQADDHLRRRVRQRGGRAPRREGVPEDRLRLRLGRRPRQPELLRLRQLDPRARLPARRARRLADEDEPARHRRRLPGAGGEPARERVHLGRALGEQEGGRQGHLHQQLVRPGDGEGGGAGADRREGRRDLRRAGRRDRGRQAEEHHRLREHVRPEGGSRRGTSSRARSGT